MLIVILLGVVERGRVLLLCVNGLLSQTHSLYSLNETILAGWLSRVGTSESAELDSGSAKFVLV